MLVIEQVLRQHVQHPGQPKKRQIPEQAIQPFLTIKRAKMFLQKTLQPNHLLSLEPSRPIQRSSDSFLKPHFPKKEYKECSLIDTND